MKQRSKWDTTLIVVGAAIFLVASWSVEDKATAWALTGLWLMACGLA